MDTSSSSSSSSSSSKLELLCQLINDVNIPSCSICGDTDWFIDDDDDIADSTTTNNNNNNNKYKSTDEYIEQRAKDFIPFPRCDCNTILLTNPIASQLDKMFEKQQQQQQQQQSANKNDSPKNKRHLNIEHTALLDILLNQSQLSTKDIIKFPNRGMCRPHLKQFIENTQQVIEHDYRDENQPNQHFSLQTKCSHCSCKFSPRTLGNLLSYNPSSETLTGKKYKKKNSNNWNDALVNTIKFVRFRRRLKSALTDAELKRSRFASNHNSLDKDSNTVEIEAIATSNLVQKWVEADFNSSDNCFQSDDEENDFDTSNKNRNHQSKSNTNHLPLREGELRDELLKKDPLFRQEVEDRIYVENLLNQEKKYINHQDESKRAKQMETDETYAKKLQGEFGSSSSVKKSSIVNYLCSNNDKMGRTSASMKQIALSDSNSNSTNYDRDHYLIKPHVDQKDDQVIRDLEYAKKLDNQLNHDCNPKKPLSIRNYIDPKRSEKNSRRRQIENRNKKSLAPVQKSGLTIYLNVREQKLGIDQHISIGEVRKTEDNDVQVLAVKESRKRMKLDQNGKSLIDLTENVQHVKDDSKDQHLSQIIVKPKQKDDSVSTDMIDLCSYDD